jgi:hypothetical protein
MILAIRDFNFYFYNTFLIIKQFYLILVKILNVKLNQFSL